MYTEDQAPVTGTLGANVPSPDPGKPVQLTAKVAGPSGRANAGTVIFSATSTGTSTGATTTICSATPVNGVATCAWVPGPAPTPCRRPLAAVPTMAVGHFQPARDYV